MHNIKIEITNDSINDFLQDMNLARTYFNQQVKRKIRQSKNMRITDKSRKQTKSCLQKPNWPEKKQKMSQIEQKNKNIFLSTFVNIKNARYQIGPLQQYNCQNIQFPSFGRKVNRSAKQHYNPEDLTLSWSILNSSARSVQRSSVKKSWDRYMNINSLNKYDKNNQNSKRLRKTFHIRSKDKTEQNIQGWKQDFHQQDFINV